MRLEKGIVIAVGNNYVEVKINNEVSHCLIKGQLKFNASKILVGDHVLINRIPNSLSLVTEVLPRINELYRPRIANVNQVLIVSSLVKPAFSSFLLNKLLTIYNFYHLKVVLIFTKVDLITADDEVWKKVAAYEALAIPIIIISNVNKSGIKKLTAILDHKLSLLTGTSGVGKSSTLNSINSDLKLWTQEISTALQRGKHTTTATRLYFLSDGIIADTPGFSVFQLQGLTVNDIANNFPSFNNIWKQCKFRNCLHQLEPQCAIKAAIANNLIPQFFYEDYCKILLEFKRITK